MDDYKLFTPETETASEKFLRKSKDSPFMVVGIAGMLCAVGIGAYKYKYRGQMSTSIYLMQLRVIAQGTVVGSLALGIIYNMYSSIKNKHTKSDE